MKKQPEVTEDKAKYHGGIRVVTSMLSKDDKMITDRAGYNRDFYAFWIWRICRVKLKTN